MMGRHMFMTFIHLFCFLTKAISVCISNIFCSPPKFLDEILSVFKVFGNPISWVLYVILTILPCMPLCYVLVVFNSTQLTMELGGGKKICPCDSTTSCNILFCILKYSWCDIRVKVQDLLGFVRSQFLAVLHFTRLPLFSLIQSLFGHNSWRPLSCLSWISQHWFWFIHCILSLRY